MTSGILAGLVNGAVLGSMVSAGAWLMLRIAPRRMLNAATRYAIWWGVLAVVVLLPVGYMRGPSQAPVVDAAPVVADVDVVASPVGVDSSPMVAAASLSEAPVSRRLQLPFEIGAWATRILWAWAAIAGFMLIRLAAGIALLERRKAHGFVPPPEASARLGNWVEICGTRRRIRLAASAEIPTPMAAGPWRPSILIPAALFAELEAPELDQVGLHEVTHLARWDDCALILQRMIEALFALHPAVWFLARKIDLEREIACDDFVVEATGRARTYAACLTRIVELSGGVRGSLVAAAAAEERSHLAQRVEMLLDRTRHTGTRLLKARLTAVLVALTALAWMAAKAPALVAFAIPPGQSVLDQSLEPAIEQVPATPAAPRAPSTPSAPTAPVAMAAPVAEAPQTPPSPASPASPASPVSPPSPASPASPALNSFDVHRWYSRDGLTARDLRIQGNIEFTDDDSDVKSVSSGGWFSYEESHGFSSRRYQVLGDGAMTRRYTVDGRDRPLDEEARAWLRSSIPDILRESGINAPARVRRILRQGGAQAVLAEIVRIQSTGAKCRYIQELVPIGNLNADQYQTILRMVRGMAGDGDKASMSIFLARYTLKDNLRDYLFDAISSISSSGDKRRVLTEVVMQDPSRATLTAAAKVAAGIASDGDKSAVLEELARHFRGNDDLRRPFFRTLSTISSSGDRASVLVAVLETSGNDRDTLVDALRAVSAIPSDGDKNRVLCNAATHWSEDEALRRAYFDAANSVTSSGDHRQVLLAVVMRAGVGSASLIDAVHSADHIASDGDRGQVLSVVLGRTNASNEVLVATVEAAARLNSDGDKANVLMQAVDRASGKPAVRNEIRNAAKTLHSDSDYRRVISALDRQTAL